MTTVQTIITRASTDAIFYRALATDYTKTISPYNLSKPDLILLADGLRKIRPPAGLNGFDDPILARES